METFLLAAFAVLGAIVASFVGVLSERVFTGQAWARSRSRCNSCAEDLSPVDLVPVLSWLLAQGQCRKCGARIPTMYLLLEIILAALFALSYSVLGFSIALIPFLIALATLAFVVVYDLRHTLVPFEASFSLFVVAIWFSLVTTGGYEALGVSLMTAGGIALAFLALHVFSKGKAMGLGDAPVAFSLSLLVAPYAIAGVLFSFWIGALFGILLLVLRRGGPTMGIEVPFVPFMAAGFLLAYFTKWDPLTLSLFFP